MKVICINNSYSFGGRKLVFKDLKVGSVYTISETSVCMDCENIKYVLKELDYKTDAISSICSKCSSVNASYNKNWFSSHRFVRLDVTSSETAQTKELQHV